MKMRQHDHPGLPLMEFKECGAIKVKDFADAALGIYSAIVYLVAGTLIKRGEIRSTTSQTSAAIQGPALPPRFRQFPPAPVRHPLGSASVEHQASF